METDGQDDMKLCDFSRQRVNSSPTRAYFWMSLAHRNRSDFCDLRLRCPSRTPEIARFPRQEKVRLYCDLRVRWKVASDLRFRAAISEPKTPSFCGISGDLAQSTRKSLAIVMVRFWCAKWMSQVLRFVFLVISALRLGCAWKVASRDRRIEAIPMPNRR